MSMSAADRQTMLLECLVLYMQGELTQGQLLKKLRGKVLKMTQQHYAEMVNVSRRSLVKIENDQGNPSAELVDHVFKPFSLKSGIVPNHPVLVEKLLNAELATE